MSTIEEINKDKSESRARVSAITQLIVNNPFAPMSHWVRKFDLIRRETRSDESEYSSGLERITYETQDGVIVHRASSDDISIKEYAAKKRV